MQPKAGVKYLKIQDINSKNLVHRKKFDKKNNKILLDMQTRYQVKKIRFAKILFIFLEECRKYNLKPLIAPFTHESYHRIKQNDFFMQSRLQVMILLHTR